MTGAEDAALFRSTDGGSELSEISGLRSQVPARRVSLEPGGCACTRFLGPGESRPHLRWDLRRRRFRSDERRPTWKPITTVCAPRGSRTRNRGRPLVHRIRAAPLESDRLYMQKHWDVMRSDDAGDSGRRSVCNLPTKLRVPNESGVHEHPNDLRRSGSRATPSIFRSTENCACTAAHRGNEVGSLTPDSPQPIVTSTCARCDVRRFARSVRIYFGHDGGAVYGSNDEGDTWTPIVRICPAVYSVEVQTLP